MPIRIAVLSLRFASQRGAPPMLAADMPKPWIIAGADFAAAARGASQAVPNAIAGLFRAMDATGPWDAVPILGAEAGSGGPLDQKLFEDLRVRVLAAFDAAKPVDGLFVVLSGNLAASAEADAAGGLLTALRDRAGPTFRIVASVASSCVVSDRSLRAIDAVVGDGAAAGERAALAFRLMARGALVPAVASLEIPLAMVPLHGAGLIRRRIAELAAGFERENDANIWSVVCASSLSRDVSDIGDRPNVLVTGRRDRDSALIVAQDLAEAVTRAFPAIPGEATPLDAAIAAAKADDGVRRLLLDVGDAIDAGGSGRSTELLSALVWSGASGVLMACHHDSGVARQAQVAGLGARIIATFNAADGNDNGSYFEAEADVVGLATSLVGVDHPAVDAARRASGPAAALDFGGVTVIVSSRRLIVRDAAVFTALGCDLAGARTVVLKGRYETLTAGLRTALPVDVMDVDTPGATTGRRSGDIG